MSKVLFTQQHWLKDQFLGFKNRYWLIKMRIDSNWEINTIYFAINGKYQIYFLLIFLSFCYSHYKLKFPSACNSVLPSASPQTSWFFPDVFIWELVSNESPCCKHTRTHIRNTHNYLWEPLLHLLKNTLPATPKNTLMTEQQQHTVQEKSNQPRAQGWASRYERQWCMISVKGQYTGEQWRSRGENVKMPL